MIRNIWVIACFTGILIFGAVSACQEDFSVPYLIPQNTMISTLDTVTIKVTNLVITDSVVSINKEVGFSGFYNDPQIGAIEAQTFIEFNRTIDRETNRFARFDSVTLVLRPNGSYFGDTVKRATFKVSKISKPIEALENGLLYSTSTVPFDVPHLVEATRRVQVKDVANNEFEIRLPNSFGEWLLQGIIRDDEDFSNDEFRKTFPGLAIGAGAGSDCIHGLIVRDTACMIRIYYHVNTSVKEERTMLFKANSYNSFYHMSNDKVNLPDYNSKSDPVSSSATGNRGVIMSGGTPMYARLEFPYLNELLRLGQIVVIQKATLYVRPVQRSFDMVPLPPKLNIYYFDPTSNTPLSSAIRPPSSGQNVGPQDGNLPENYRFIQSPNFPQYSFDVTDFVAHQLDKRGHEKWALSLVIPANARDNTIQRLVFGDQNFWYRNEHQSKDNQIKLEITYAVYND